jgi:uncharacterized protein (TIGR03437 family)
MRFGTFLGTPAQTSFPQRMLLDAEGDIVVAGATYARRPGDFPVTSPLQATPGNQINGTCSANDHSFSCSDVFVMKLRPQGGPPLVSALFGGVDDDVLLGMAQDRGGGLHLLVRNFPGLPLGRAVAGDSAVVRIAPGGLPPMMEPRGVVSAAGYTPGITRGGVGSLFGSGFLDRDGVRVAASFPLPLALEATSVWVNGVAAPILAIGKAGQQDQINFQVPTSYLAAPAAAATMNNIIVRRGDALGFVFGFRMASPSSPIPGIFVDAAGQPAVTHADGSLLSSASPARPGERIVIFATGLGDVTPVAGRSSGAGEPASAHETDPYGGNWRPDSGDRVLGARSRFRRPLPSQRNRPGSAGRTAMAHPHGRRNSIEGRDDLCGTMKPLLSTRSGVAWGPSLQTP